MVEMLLTDIEPLAQIVQVHVGEFGDVLIPYPIGKGFTV